jgi:hypothetical protein
VGDASITDAALIKFLSASGPWLEQLQSVDLKQCHYVTGQLLAFLRSACPKLSKLSPSRWIDNAAMAEMAFPGLQVCVCLRAPLLPPAATATAAAAAAASCVWQCCLCSRAPESHQSVFGASLGIHTPTLCQLGMWCVLFLLFPS